MKMFLYCAFIFLFTHAVHSVHAATYTLHTVHSGSVPSRVRIINLSDTDGVVEIVGFDDEGEEYGPVELDIEAHASVVLLTRELENGAPDKGLMDGLGDGSGQWQIELTTDLQIGAVSFKGGVLSDVLSSAELTSGDGLPSHFLRVNRLYDRKLSWRMSPGLLRASDKRYHAYLELLSAYDWMPAENVQGVELGWGSYELRYTYDLWLQYGSNPELSPWTTYLGYLDHGVFAVTHGMVNGGHHGQAYIAGKSLGCYESSDSDVSAPLPSPDAQWSGALVVVTEDGRFGHGPVSIEVNRIIPAWEERHNASTTSYHSPTAELTVTVSAYDVDTQKPLFGEELQGVPVPMILNDAREIVADFMNVQAYGRDCAEIAGWIASPGHSYWAFGARRTDTTE